MGGWPAAADPPPQQISGASSLEHAHIATHLQEGKLAIKHELVSLAKVRAHMRRPALRVSKHAAPHALVTRPVAPLVTRGRLPRS